MNIAKLVLNAIGSLFKGIWTSVLGASDAKVISNAVKSVIVTDAGKLALDAVQFIAAKGLAGVEARDAAKAKLVADAKALGKDLLPLGEAALNLVIEIAYTAFKAKLAGGF